MKPRWVWVLLAGLFLAADKPRDAAQVDLDKMQGTWTVEVAAKTGDAAPRELLDRLKVTITGDKISIREGDQGKAEEATIKLDPTQKPKAMDITPAGGGADEKKVEGIYQLDGDTLKLCWTKGKGPRPTEFATSKENRQVLFVLKRAK